MAMRQVAVVWVRDSDRMVVQADGLDETTAGWCPVVPPVHLSELTRQGWVPLGELLPRQEPNTTRLVLGLP